LLRIFEPYFSTKEIGAVKGQGLSLAICRAILLAHGGSITVDSTPGSGSAFHVFLPVQT
jgi:signal transduction histidine kinase